jgi:hypothetical protein
VAGVDWLAVAVAGGTLAFAGFAFWLVSDRDWREALDDAYGDVPHLNEELAADRGSSRGGGGFEAADRRHRPHHTHGGAVDKS